MDFEPAKSPNVFMDCIDTLGYMGESLDYSTPYPSSPSFGIHVNLLPPESINAQDPMSNFSNYDPFCATPTRPYTPPDGASISSHGLAYISGGELSSDSCRRSGTQSPPIFPASVPRSHRYTPLPSAAVRTSVRTQKRKQTKSVEDTEDDDDDFQPDTVTSGTPEARRETIRKQRIQSEQRRRDELRDGYVRLKEILPQTSQKSSKVTLLDRATHHIRQLQTVQEQLEMRLKAAETEVHRLRSVNEALMLTTARHSAAANVPLAGY